MLDNYDPGDTLSFSELSDILTNTKIENDVYELQFPSHMTSLFQRKILVGQINSLSQIISVQIIFYNDNGGIVEDSFGNQLDYTSNPHDLGHVLDILEQGFTFSYAICRLRLQPDSNFDPHTLFFHCSKSSSSIPLSSKK
jgi:hypothetical protein